MAYSGSRPCLSTITEAITILEGVSRMVASGEKPLKIKDIPTLARFLRDRIEPVCQHQISVRPWNRFRPNQSLWWIIPSRKDWPAYKHGKFFLTQDRTNPEDLSLWNLKRLFVGLHVESGLSPKAASTYGSSDKLERNSDWLWGSFLSDLGKGEVVKALGEVFQTIRGIPKAAVSVVIETSYPFGDGSDREKWKLLGRARLDFDGRRLIPITCTCSDSFSELKRVRVLNELKAVLLDLANLTWVDIFLGAIVTAESAETIEENTLAEVCKYLAPWDKWFV